jgi:hypothetical protein
MNAWTSRNLAGLCACVLGAQCANAWDATGHMLVAQIARDRMSSQAVARVDALAATLDNNGVPYNGVSVACWPDDIKSKDFKSPFQGQFRSWHYIDIGCSTNDLDALTHPPVLTTNSGDVVLALNHCLAILKTKKTSDLVPNEAVALALLMHFVGDIHQPLHCASRYNPDPQPTDKYKNDAGGNGVTLANLADTPWGKNLHTFWDEAYRRYYDNGEVRAWPELPEATALGSPEMKDWITKLAPLAPAHPDLEVDFKKWALQTHALACEDVYGKLGAPYGARDVKLTEKYVAEATELARRQLELAGYRLAAILNDIYGR